jgi:fatty acid desaturase
MIADPAAPMAQAPHLADDLEEALDAAAATPLSRRDVPRDLLPTATVATLLRMAGEEWCLILALWTAMALAPSWVYWILLLPLAGRFHALGVILHDATHMPLRRKTPGVRLVEALCGYPIATTLNAMRYHHLRHHRDSGMGTDPYYKAGEQGPVWWTLNTLRGLVMVPFWTVRALIGAGAYLVPSWRNVYARVFLQERAGGELRERREVIDCARAEYGQLAFQSALLALAVAWPAAVVWGYVVPVSVAGVLAARRVLIEHNYERATDRRLETTLAVTNDNYLGWLGALALAPRNIGYHVVHHIHPQVTLKALPKLRQWYQREHPEIYPPARR